MRNFLAWSIILTGALLIASGCGKKPDAKAQTAELEKAFPGLPAAGTPDTATNDPKAVVGAAISAARAGDYGKGVILLKSAARMPGMTPEQIMALQATRSAWMTELMGRANSGDEQAKAALTAINQAQ